MFFDIISFIVSNRGFILVFRMLQLLISSLTATYFTSVLYLLLEGLLFSHRPSDVAFMITMGAIIGDLMGHYLAAPGLLLFLLWSLWAWDEGTPNFWLYTLTGGIVAGVNGAFYFTPDRGCHGDCIEALIPPVGYPELILFIASGFATAALHWRWRNKERIRGSSRPSA